jgi:hypothetical protein
MVGVVFKIIVPSEQVFSIGIIIKGVLRVSLFTTVMGEVV